MTKWKQWISTLLGAVLVLTSFCIPINHSNAYGAASSDPALPIQVDWNEIESQTTPYSFGLNAFKIFDPNVSSSSGYNQNMAYMNPGFIRIHGWEFMKDSKDPNDNRGWLDIANKTWDAEKINDALSGYQANDAQFLMDIPGFPSWMKTYDVKDSNGKTVVTLLDPSEFDNYAAFCAELVRIINVTYSHHVTYWEPTNERDDLYYVQLRNAGLPDKLDELITIYNKAAKAMKAVDSSIKTGGLAFARGDLYDQVRRFVQGTKNEGTIDFLSYHFYASGDMGESNQQIYNRVYNPSEPAIGTFAKHTKDIRQIVDEEVTDRHIPIFANEFNISWSWTNDDPRMRNEKGAVFDALGLIYGHDNGVDGFNAWNERDGVYGKTDDNNNLRTPAHVYQLFNNYLIGSRVSSESSDEKKIAVFAVKNGKTQSLAIVNRSDEAQLLEGDFVNGNHSNQVIKEHQITEAGYAISTTSWAQLLSGQYVVPPNSVTVLTNSSKVPSILPAPLPALTPKDAPQTSGLLTGASNEAPQAVDLTSEGSLDWAYWGRESAASEDRKQAAAPLISKQVIGNGVVVQDTDLSTGISWADGGGVQASASNVKSAAVIKTKDDKFQITVPADLTKKVLKLYLGVKGMKGKLTATLSDNSAAPYTVELDNSAWITDREIELSYSAASPGQTLTVVFDLVYVHWDGGLRLQAAALSEPQSSGAGVLDATVTPSEKANFTAEGTLDWVHWGLSDASSVTKKAQAASLISSIAPVGAPSFSSYQGDWWGTHKASWTDGDAQLSATETTTALKSVGDNSKQGMGFQFTVPADRTARTLKIYLGAMGARGELTASLSDGSAPNFSSGNEHSPTKIENTGGATTRVVTLNYKAATDGQTLTIKYVLGWDHWGSTLWMQGATLALADMEPPTAPGNPSVTVKTATTAALSWNQASDNVGITGYEIYNGPDRIGSTKGSSFFIKGLLPGQQYHFIVKAKDQAGNYSAGSTVTVATESDMLPPTVPGDLQEDRLDDDSEVLAWKDSFDNIGVIAYDIYLNSELVGTTTDTWYSISTADPNAIYHYAVVAKDAAGNESEGAALVIGDTEAPKWPANSELAASNIEQTHLNVSWPPAEDQNGIQSYHIQVNGTAAATVASSVYSYQVTGLMPDTAYTIRVVAADPSGNLSVDGLSNNVKTLAAPSSGNTGEGSSTDGHTDNKQLLTPSMLDKEKDGIQTVTLRKGATILAIPQSVLPLLSGQSVEVKVGNHTILFPSSILEQLVKLQSSQQGEIQLRIELYTAAKPAADSLYYAGAAYGLSAVVAHADGTISAAETMNGELSVTFAVDQTFDSQLLGVYHLNKETGKWDYIGGKLDSKAGVMQAFGEEAGVYGLFELKQEFNDVKPEHWAYRAVQVLAAKHVITGVTNEQFSPKRPISRAEFITILARALGLKASESVPFKDVDPNAYYAAYAAAAYEAGIINGRTSNEFAPGADITREEMAVILIRAVTYNNSLLTTEQAASGFADQYTVSEWANHEVLAAKALGLLKGGSKGLFSPKAAVTRAETVQAIYNLLSFTE
ncbi:S-layer homology domain-containing protein [Paenibacillus sp. GCM10023252]|uniref:S-layer homology domain-containing protein n=1 Tax=Paenibacillus sp. GCM10023252 TaxID=3252649 RepID=UPI00360650C5